MTLNQFIDMNIFVIINNSNMVDDYLLVYKKMLLCPDLHDTQSFGLTLPQLAKPQNLQCTRLSSMFA